MATVGVIPARGGSKRVELKNLKIFNGKPLIAWAIESARESGVFDRVIVSTDDERIAEAARQYGADVPFRQPDELATDRSPVEPVLKYAIEWLKEHENLDTEYVALLLATNPLRQPAHVQKALEILRATGADSVVAVNETPANHTPYWTLVRNPETQKVELFGGIPMKNIYDRRQDFPQQCFARNDLVYFLKPKNLYEEKPNLYGAHLELMMTSPLFEGDINTPEDWIDCELKFQRIQRMIANGEEIV